MQCVIHSARFRGWAVISCWGGDRRTGEAREASSPPNSRQHMSAISPGREINDVFFASLLNILVSLPSLSYCDLLFFFPIREVCLKSSSSSSVLFSGVHGFLYTFLLLSLLRPTSYAQKLWRTRWTRCGTKHWCTMASQRPTWPPKRSGRSCSLFLVSPQPDDQFVKVEEIHSFRSFGGSCHQPSLPPGGLYQVVNDLNQATPANCSARCCCGNSPGVASALSLRPPLVPTVLFVWRDVGQAWPSWPKKSDALPSSCMRKLIQTHTCVLFVNVSAASDRRQSAQQIHNRVGWDA